MSKLDDYKYQQEQKRKLFKECFSTPAGQQVLKELEDEFYDCPIDPGETAEYNLGRRDVVYQIKQMINRSTA